MSVHHICNTSGQSKDTTFRDWRMVIVGTVAYPCVELVIFCYHELPPHFISWAAAETDCKSIEAAKSISMCLKGLVTEGVNFSGIGVAR